MPSGFVNRSADLLSKRMPGLRGLPIVRLLALAEVAMMARGHLMRLDPGERRRLFELVRAGRGRPSNLDPRDRIELARLVAKMEPRLLAGAAAEKLSPLPLPKTLLYGRRRRH
jgi:hypothetical protein